jgi:hypothetical protein
MGRTDWLLALLVILAAGAVSYGMAAVGDPETRWLWCSVLGVCNWG